jgi:Holliday junction resolvase RusA-like endonuclease
MSQLLTVELDSLPPALNHAYVTTQSGRRIMSDEARHWQQQATLLISNALQLQFTAYAPPPVGKLTVPSVAVTIYLYSPKVWTFDLDGRLKQLLDAIASATGIDDRYFIDLYVHKRYATEPAIRAVVEIGMAFRRAVHDGPMLVEHLKEDP